MNRYRWNATSARYYDSLTGRFVARDAVRRALDRVIDGEQEAIAALANQLRAGSIDLATWQEGMRDAIKTTALNAGYAAVGGRAQMTQADYGFVGAYVRKQYGYLDAFTSAIRRGLTLDGRFIARARMYADSARAAFHELQADVLTDAGYTRERSILHPAEHCAECLDQAALGIVPLGTCIPIGQRECLGNCHCTMRYYP